MPGCNRPKVRLRARKVLCHNCKEVCNDRGENLQQQYQAGGGGGIKPGDVRYVMMVLLYDFMHFLTTNGATYSVPSGLANFLECNVQKQNNGI